MTLKEWIEFVISPIVGAVLAFISALSIYWVNELRKKDWKLKLILKLNYINDFWLKLEDWDIKNDFEALSKLDEIKDKTFWKEIFKLYKNLYSVETNFIKQNNNRELTDESHHSNSQSEDIYFFEHKNVRFKIFFRVKTIKRNTTDIMSIKYFLNKYSELEIDYKLNYLFTDKKGDNLYNPNKTILFNEKISALKFRKNSKIKCVLSQKKVNKFVKKEITKNRKQMSENIKNEIYPNILKTNRASKKIDQL